MIDQSKTCESMVNIRSATEEDLPRIKELVRGARINPMGLNWERFLVAEDLEGEVIGCGQVKQHRSGVLEMASIVVDEAYQGGGIARELIEKLKSLSDPPVWLMCRSDLVPLYEKFKFREIREPEEMPRYFSRMLRLASTFMLFSSGPEYLAVMVWKGEKNRTRT